MFLTWRFEKAYGACNGLGRAEYIQKFRELFFLQATFLKLEFLFLKILLPFYPFFFVLLIRSLTFRNFSLIYLILYFHIPNFLIFQHYQ